jgi:hypothetical protein
MPRQATLIVSPSIMSNASTVGHPTPFVCRFRAFFLRSHTTRMVTVRGRSCCRGSSLPMRRVNGQVSGTSVLLDRVTLLACAGNTQLAPRHDSRWCSSDCSARWLWSSRPSESMACFVFRRAAHARNRRAHDARSAAPRRSPHGPRPGRKNRADRDCHRNGGRFRTYTVDVQPSFFRQRQRPCDVCRRGHCARPRRDLGLLHSRAPCHSRRSYGCAATRIISAICSRHSIKCPWRVGVQNRPVIHACSYLYRHDCVLSASRSGALSALS